MNKQHLRKGVGWKSMDKWQARISTFTDYPYYPSARRMTWGAPTTRGRRRGRTSATRFSYSRIHCRSVRPGRNCGSRMNSTGGYTPSKTAGSLDLNPRWLTENRPGGEWGACGGLRGFKPLPARLAARCCGSSLPPPPPARPLASLRPVHPRMHTGEPRRGVRAVGLLVGIVHKRGNHAAA